MLKKLFVIAMFAVASTAIFASGDQFKAPVDYFSGGYIGLGLGGAYATGNGDHAVTDTVTVIDDVFSVPFGTDKSFGEAGFAGDLFGGYGHTFARHFYAGGEGFVRYVPFSVDENQRQTSTSYGVQQPSAQFIADTSFKISSDYSFGASGRFGFLATPRVMIYALLGLDVTEFDYSIDHKILDDDGSVLFDFQGNDGAAVAAGVMPGIGVAVMVNKHIGLRGQYTFSYYYGDFDDAVTNNVTIVDGVTLQSASTIDFTNLTRSVLTLQALYRF